MKSGKGAIFEQFAKIAVIRETKERTISREEFSRVVAVIRSNNVKFLDMNAPATKSLLREFDKYLSKEFSKEVKTMPGETTPLGVLIDQPDVYSMMFFATIKRDVNGSISSYPVLATLNVLHIKDRLISIATYRGYHSEADVETLKTFTTNWVNTILTANKQ